MKKIINIETWERKEHYLFFRNLELPTYSITIAADITNALKISRENKISLHAIILYATLKAVNAIPALKWRIENDQITEYDTIHSAATHLPKGSRLYSNTFCKYNPDFEKFSENLKKAIEKCEQKPSLHVAGTRQDVAYISALPWINFTSITNPLTSLRNDSVPRFVWGKYKTENGKTMLPYGIQFHHSLADGIDAAEFFETFQKEANKEENYRRK